MGFFDKLKAAWSGPSWDAAWNDVKSVGHDLAGSGRQMLGGTWNMVSGLAHLDSDRFTKGMRAWGENGVGALRTIGDVSKVPMDTPWLGPVLSDAGVVQNELVKRPLSAFDLTAGDALLGRRGGLNFTSLDSWKRAYNQSETVSTGQAWTYEVGAGYRAVLGNKVPVFDPRDPEQRKQYDKGVLKVVSGGIDATADVFADPTVAGGKAAKIAKLRYLPTAFGGSKLMDAAAIARGTDKTASTLASVDKTFDYTRNVAKNADQLHQTVLSRHVNGGVAANALWDAAHIADEPTARQVFHDTMQSMWGDQQAWESLTQRAPRIAQETGDRYANQTMGTVLSRAQDGDPEALSTLAARRETNVQAFADSIVNGKGVWGQVPGALANQTMPRVTLTSKWRYGVHQAFNGAPAVIFGTDIGPALKAVRPILPSSTFTRVMYLDAPNQEHLFRANLEAARALDPQRVGELTDSYARATTRESRYRVIENSEGEVFKAIAARHGYTPAEAEAALPRVQANRTAVYQQLTGARRYMSNDLRDLGKNYLSAGQVPEAHAVHEAADAMDAAVVRGEQPASVIAHFDPDNNLVLMPENFDVSASPLLLSQHAPVLPMADWRVVSQQLRWANKGVVGQQAYKLLDRTTGLADAANHAWKAATLLRPGQVLRTNSDDTLRAWAMVGTSNALMGTARGFANARENMWHRGQLLADWYQDKRARRRLATHEVADGAVVEEAPANGSLASKTALSPHVGFDNSETHNIDGVPTYASYNHALADGALSVDDFLATINEHADLRPGTLPDELAHMVQQHREGFIDDATFAQHAVEHSLGEVGRNAYADSDWAHALVDDITAAHGITTPDDATHVLRIGSADENLDAASKPHGLYVSMVDDPKTFVSPHEHVGDIKHWGAAKPKNPLVADEINVAHERGAGVGSFPASAGVAGLRKLVGAKRFGELLKYDKPQMRELLEREFPGPDYGQYHDSYELLEAYAGQVARQRGHDAIVLRDKVVPAFSEMVLLKNDAAKFGPLREAARKPQGQIAAPLAVDPFTGQTTPLSTLDGYDLTKATPLPAGQEADAITDFVRANHDDLLKPRSVLATYVAPDGSIRAAVARAGDSIADIPKLTGGKRIKMLGREGALYQDAGTRGTVVRHALGVTRFEGGFTGPMGDKARSLVSAEGPGRAWADSINDRNMRQLMNNYRWQGSVTPEDPHYGESWQRAVNLQLANDPVARQFLAGRNVDTVLAWYHTTSEGRAYQARLGAFWQPRYAEQAQLVKDMVDRYVPDVGDLRAKALDGKARHADLEAAVPDQTQRPMVHGASVDSVLPSGIMAHMNGFVDKAFKLINDIPNNKAARFPFYAERYNAHIAALAKTSAVQHAKAGFQALPAEAMDRLKSQAHAHALADVQKYLYDNATQYEVAKLGRLVVPFGSAAMDSYVKWGRIVKEKPWVPIQLWKMWTAPDHAGLLQDDQGNHMVMENGHETWYQVDPTTHESTRLPDDYRPKDRYVVLPGIGPKLTKDMRAVTSFNKDTFNTLLALPTTGPFVAVPVNKFALSHPSVADNTLVKKFIMPFGPTANTGSQFVPGDIRTAWSIFTNSDAQMATSQAMAIYATEVIEYNQGRRAKPPTFAEVQAKAGQLKVLRFLGQASGFTPQFKSPYQPYIDAYHNLQRQPRKSGDPTADEAFYKQFGPEYFALVASVTRNAAGIPATLAAYQGYKDYQKLIDAHPDIGSWIAGGEGAGEFNKAVYEAQKVLPRSPGDEGKQREPMSLAESVRDAAVRQGWIEWGKVSDAIHADLKARGLHDINQRGAEDLLAAQQKFVEDHMVWQQAPAGGTQINPWYEEFNKRDDAKMTVRLNSLVDVVNSAPRKFLGRDDVRGLIDYLSAREEMQATMRAQGIKTLDSKKALPLQRQWNAFVFDLKDSNLAFASMHDRWLGGDRFLTARLIPDGGV